MNLRLIGPTLFLLLSSCVGTTFSSEKASVVGKSVFDGELNQPDANANGLQNNGDPTGAKYVDPRGPDVFANGNTPGGGNAGGNTPGANTPGGINPKGPDSMANHPDGTNGEIDLVMMCSDRRSNDNANFKRAYDENLPVQLLVGTSICTDNKAEIKAIVQKKKFVLGDAQRLCPTLVPSLGKWENVSIVVDGTSYDSTRGVITLLYALNTETSPATQAADALCDKRASPLVIHLNSNPDRPQGIELSSQDDGVRFDLLGARSNYQLVQISWFTNSEYGMLALPDANGEVHGVDQLFGDNTFGPDGRFADNGYAALAKYDSRKDGRIDSKDSVYSKLRVWVDRNRDGIGQPSEMISLRKAGITFVDLEYSTAFAETDRYGNQTLMKSVVGRADGTLDLIFDLWFAYKF